MRGWLWRLQLLLALASAVILGSESLLSQIRDSPNLEGQVPVYIPPRNRTAQLYPQALHSLFVASNDSEGYGRGIRTRIHTCHWTELTSKRVSVITSRLGPTENTVLLLLKSFPLNVFCLRRHYPVTALLFCLSCGRCLVTDIVSRSLPNKGSHATIWLLTRKALIRLSDTHKTYISGTASHPERQQYLRNLHVLISQFKRFWIDKSVRV
jgi:hypothetical protein